MNLIAAGWPGLRLGPEALGPTRYRSRDGFEARRIGWRSGLTDRMRKYLDEMQATHKCVGKDCWICRDVAELRQKSNTKPEAGIP